MNEFGPIEFPKVETRPVPGWPGYFVSDDGHVYSQLSGLLKLLKPSRGGGNDRNYLYITLTSAERNRRIGIHQVVALAFLPPPTVTSGVLQSIVRHRDNNPHNNRASNLRWGTQAENLNDRVEAGTMTWGENNGNAKLFALDVIQIRQRRLAGEKYREIAALYGINVNEAHRIAIGRRWKHIGADVQPFASRVRSPRGTNLRKMRHEIREANRAAAALADPPK